jgi:Fic family protein
MCAWLDRRLPTESDPTPMGTAVIHAVLAHLYLEWIHPFGDGNGRTGRLVEFQILAAGGIPGPRRTC